MKALCFGVLPLLLVSVSAPCSAFNSQDIIDLKKAGLSDEIILLMTKPTRSLEPKEIIELKRSGLSEESIKEMIRADLKEQPDTAKIGHRLVIDEIMNLRKSGVSDETIQKMLDREERERARYSGVARKIKHPDGSESIIYGDLKNAPYPDTKHYYISTSEYLRSLYLNINEDDTLTPDEKELWNQVLEGLRLRKEVD